MHRKTRQAGTMLLVTTIALAALAPTIAVAQDDGPITLQLAVADDVGKPSEPMVEAFIDATGRLSGGSITIEPTWAAGGDDFEQGTARLLVDGKADLALAASRAWDSVGASSLEALQAPFLIDNDALASAVAQSDIATHLLDSLSGVGVSGLAMWPEDLRHPAVFAACADPLVTPSAFAGRTIRAIPSAVTDALMTALGATRVDNFPDDSTSCDVQGAESGLAQGTTLPGHPTFTGDVTFYPKFQVLAANSASYGRLSETQQDVLRQAAAEARAKAVAGHPAETELAQAWCAAGGQVVLAGADRVAAFEAAAKPVYDELLAGADTVATIEAIRGLKRSTPPSSGAVACGEPAPVATPNSASATAAPLPAGTYRATITAEMLESRGESTVEAQQDAATITITVSDGRFTVSGDKGGSCTAYTSVEVDHIVLAWQNSLGPCDGQDRVKWQLDGDALSIIPVATSPEFAAVFGAIPFQRIQ